MKWETWLLLFNRFLDVFLPPAGLFNAIFLATRANGIWDWFIVALWTILAIIWTNFLVSKIKERRF